MKRLYPIVVLLMAILLLIAIAYAFPSTDPAVSPSASIGTITARPTYVQRYHMLTAEVEYRESKRTTQTLEANASATQDPTTPTTGLVDSPLPVPTLEVTPTD